MSSRLSTPGSGSWTRLGVESAMSSLARKIRRDFLQAKTEESDLEAGQCEKGNF